MVLENEDKLREVEQLLNELNNNEWKNDEIEEIKKDIEIIKNEETIKLEHNKLINDNAYFREQIKIAEKNNDEKMVLENEDKLRKTETKLKIINELDSLKLQRKELEKDILDYREQIKIAEKNNDEKMVLENENELREVEYRKKENEQRVEELINNYNDLEKEKEDIEVEKEKEDLEVEKEKEDLEVEKEDNSEKKKKNKKPFWKKWFRKNN